MTEDLNIFGCFVSITEGLSTADTKTKELAKEQGSLFLKYIWGEMGTDNKINILKHSDYGQDLLLILLQFYVNPLPIQIQILGEIERYRKNEKSIGCPIIVDGDFFKKSELERLSFIKNAIFQKIDLLEVVIKKKKLDTNISLLRADLQNILG